MGKYQTVNVASDLAAMLLVCQTLILLNLFFKLNLNLVFRDCYCRCVLWLVEPRILSYAFPATLICFMPLAFEILSKVLFESLIHSNCHLTLILWATPQLSFVFLALCSHQGKEHFFTGYLRLCHNSYKEHKPSNMQFIFIRQNILWGTVLVLHSISSISLLSKDSKEKQFIFWFS